MNAIMQKSDSLADRTREIRESAESQQRWLETAPSYAEVLAAKLQHTCEFSVLYDLIGDTTTGMGRDYP